MQSHAQPLIDSGPAGLPVIYAIPAGGFDVVVNGDHLLSWGIEPSELQDAALRNLAAWAADAPWSEEVSGDRRVISSDTGDGLDAVRILLPDSIAYLASELGGGGRVLVGIPERHLLLASTLRRRRRGVCRHVRRVRHRAVGRRRRARRSTAVRARRRSPGRIRRMTDGLRVEVDGPVATITLDRPEAMNALTVPVKVALREALEAIGRDRAVRAVILTGAGRAFCAGQDLAEREQPDAAPLDVEVRERYNPIIRAIRSIGQPVIAAVNGVAAGAGASLAFACDLRIAAEEARFVLAFGRIGLVPDSGATWFLPRLVGSAKAAELALVGDAVDAAEALRLGLVSRVVPGERLMDEARALAAKIADGPPLAFALTKAALQRAMTIDLDEALDGEAKLQGIAGASADHAEGLAAFREKRPPRFSGS